VDQGCSKATKFLPCNKTIDGKGVAQLYFKHLFPWFSIPKRIISDHVTPFGLSLVPRTNLYLYSAIMCTTRPLLSDLPSYLRLYRLCCYLNT
jgi:hypothetical protein